ncbi:Hypothetical protein PHPALM_51 [Phytophthora palmivora]|uniref:Chromo domain-containing protein n=1 Tax=Phytophthora palmivora TaxID=4796 RepID=A0A2P4YVT4_9STRA|nr:Hypothetical protein PHPALM_51 [Phytophthora palmivora]
MRDIYDRNHEELVFNVGPYPVVRRVYNHTYKLNIQAGTKRHPAINSGSLKRYKEPTRLSKPSEVLFAVGSVGQVIKSIKRKRRRERRTEFLVEWVGEEQ